MVHDLFANFYCKSDDKEPKYRCPIGLVTKGENFLLSKGFARTSEPYYQDYEKVVSKTELQKWMQNGYVSEVMDVLFCGENFERIVLEALMLEPADNKGTLPERMVQLVGVNATFYNTDPMSPVYFQEEGSKEITKKFVVPLCSLKKTFNVLTLMEVMSKLQKFGENLNWTLEQWKQYLEEN